jgi:hypothetical protein
MQLQTVDPLSNICCERIHFEILNPLIYMFFTTTPLPLIGTIFCGETLVADYKLIRSLGDEKLNMPDINESMDIDSFKIFSPTLLNLRFFRVKDGKCMTYDGPFSSGYIAWKCEPEQLLLEMGPGQMAKIQARVATRVAKGIIFANKASRMFQQHRINTFIQRQEIKLEGLLNHNLKNLIEHYQVENWCLSSKYSLLKKDLISIFEKLFYLNLFFFFLFFFIYLNLKKIYQEKKYNSKHFLNYHKLIYHLLIIFYISYYFFSIIKFFIIL